MSWKAFDYYYYRYYYIELVDFLAHDELGTCRF